MFRCSRFLQLSSVALRRALLCAFAAGVLVVGPSSTVYAVTANIFGNVVPAIPNSNPEGPAEIGTYFTSTIAVDITGFRWYAGPQTVAEQTGTYTGKLWLEADQSLITFADFGTLTQGWNEVLLPTPFTIAANTGYVVSINHNGRYPADTNGGAGYFPVGTAPVTATRSGFNNAGLFPSIGPFPPGTSGASYFADVIFDSPLVTGDVDGDFDVDINDYVIIRNNFFDSPAVFGDGDLDLDGTVEFDDFRIWKDAFPGGAGAAEAAIAGLGVPEPATAGMIAIGMGLLGCLHRRRSVVR